MDETFATRVALHAARTPDAPAIISDRVLTYSELDALSNRIASSLGALTPSEPERPLVLLMREGPLLVAAMLAAIKACRLFTPLDARMPVEWLKGVVRDSGAGAILYNGSTRSVAEQCADGDVRAWDVEVLARAPAGVAEAKNLVTAADAPAYIIYTSGTTGRSKGVLASHRTAMYSPKVRGAQLQITPNDRIANLRPTSTQAGLSNNFLPLVHGACLLPFDLHTNGLQRLGPWLNEMEVSGLTFTGSLLRTWLAALQPEFRLTTLRFAIATAEPLYAADVQALAQRLSGDWRLMHSLASSETGLTAVNMIGPHNIPQEGVVSVGHPPRETNIQLEDEGRKITAPGERGEIVVRSPNLALGYWKDPAATEKSFSTDAAGNRVWRSGDLGRWREDGTLEHLGRRDRKIKVRGYSIEPVEVERALLSLANVHDAIVITYQARPDDTRLIGYIACGSDGPMPSGGAIREEVSKRLPAYSVPSEIIVLRALPMTLAGKIDRTALPSPNGPGSRSGEYRAPSGEHERSVASIWCKVLGLEKIGVDEDFFELGGTSLQAFTIFAELASALGCDFPPTRMISAPTIASQAALARDAAWRSPNPTLVPFRGEGTGAPLFVVHGGYGGILFARDLAKNLASGRPVFGVQPPSLDGSRPMPQTIEQAAALYLSEIRRVQPRGPYHLVGHSYGGRVVWEMAQVLARAGETVGLLALIDTLYDAQHDIPQEPSVSRARRHLSRMSSLMPGALIRYVSTRAVKTLARGTEIMGFAVRHIPNDIRMKVGLPIPYDQRSEYYFRIFSRASRRYKPAPFSGPVVMFSAIGLSDWHRKRWGPLALGGLAVHEIPAEHAEMVWPPYSATLARGLDVYLGNDGTEKASDAQSKTFVSV